MVPSAAAGEALWNSPGVGISRVMLSPDWSRCHVSGQFTPGCLRWKVLARGL